MELSFKLVYCGGLRILGLQVLHMGKKRETLKKSMEISRYF
jgi:hypothetical protein